MGDNGRRAVHEKYNWSAPEGELLKAYEFRHKLALKKWKALARSPLFWAVSLGMILASGFIAWAINAHQESVTAWQLVISGIASRSVIREVMSAKTASAEKTMGDENRITMTDMFG